MMKFKYQIVSIFFFLILNGLIVKGQSISNDTLPKSTIESDSIHRVKRALKLIEEYNLIRDKRMEKDMENLKLSFEKLNTDLTETKLALNKSHQKFKKGMWYVVIGAGIMLLSTSTSILASSRRGGGRRTRGSSPLGNSINLVGGLTLVTGIVICFDSHKFIGRAGSFQTKRKRKVLPVE